MGEYDKYYMSETPPNPMCPETRIKGKTNMVNTLWINDELQGKVPDAFYTETTLVIRPSDTDSGGKPHNHAFDEYYLFLSTNPDDLFTLDGEVEFWFDGEKHIITKSTCVFVPAGMYHCPLYFRKVDRPIMWCTTGNTLRYRHLSYDRDPKWAGLKEIDDDKVGLPPIVRLA